MKFIGKSYIMNFAQHQPALSLAQGNAAISSLSKDSIHSNLRSKLEHLQTLLKEKTYNESEGFKQIVIYEKLNSSYLRIVMK